jgi:protein-tyrosine-phosphatase
VGFEIMSSAYSILFVCLGNICRSPIAEAMAQEILGEDVRVESAGLIAMTGNRATPEAVESARERGFDIRHHRARNLAEIDLTSFDRIVALNRDIAERLESDYDVSPESLVIWEVDDPFGLDADVYRACASEIERALRGETRLTST